MSGPRIKDAEDLSVRFDKHVKDRTRWRDKRRITKADRKDFRTIAERLYELDVLIRIAEARERWSEDLASKPRKSKGKKGHK